LWIKNVDNGSLRHLASTGMDWAEPSPPDPPEGTFTTGLAQAEIRRAAWM
jgi:hypothetical protein